MKTITYKDIMALDPCYDPVERGHCAANWTGTVVDILKHADVTPSDKLWVVTQLIDNKTNRLFAVWCARNALSLVDNPDPRSAEACNVAERFANGEASSGELRAAWVVAWDAAGDAAGAAARATAWSTAWVAASAAARDAAWDAARGAAEAAASAAAWDAASAAARDAQIEKLIEMIGAAG